jgi:hypothetical protein
LIDQASGHNVREITRDIAQNRGESRRNGGIVGNILLIVCVIFLTVAFITLAHEIGRVRRVLYEQGRTIDTLNHVDAIQSRQLDIQRARLDKLRPLIPVYGESNGKCATHTIPLDTRSGEWPPSPP